MEQNEKPAENYSTSEMVEFIAEEYSPDVLRRMIDVMRQGESIYGIDGYAQVLSSIEKKISFGDDDSYESFDFDDEEYALFYTITDQGRKYALCIGIEDPTRTCIAELEKLDGEQYCTVLSGDEEELIRLLIYRELLK